MSRKGQAFNRDFEFTGCCDASMGVNSKLLNQMQNRGYRGITEIKQPSVQFSALSFPDVMGYMEDAEAKAVTVELTEDQKQKAAAVTDWNPSQLEISVCNQEKSTDILLTDGQKQLIQDALGIDMESITIARSPIETALK